MHESTLYILERKVIMILLQILWDAILPLFAFIGAGVFLDSKFKIDISTYSRLTIWVEMCIRDRCIP